MANPYKKKLATASYQEAQAMDNAYSTALKKGVPSYSYDGLSYAVQPNKARVYAADIVKARNTPVAPTTVKKPAIPATPIKKPTIAVPDTTRVKAPAPLIAKKDSVVAPPAVTRFDTVYKAASPTVNIKAPVESKPTEKVSAKTMGGASMPVPYAPATAKNLELPNIKPTIKRPSSATAIESTKVVPQTYGKKQAPSMNYADLTGGLVTAGAKAIAKHYEPALNTIEEAATLGVNGAKRYYAKNFGDDSNAVSKFPSTPAAPIRLPKSNIVPDSTEEEIREAARLRSPAVITGDTINDGGKYYHLPEVIDLTRIKAGARNRGDRTPVDSDGVIASAFDDAKFISKKDANPEGTYMGVDSQGNMKAGRGKDFSDDARVIALPFHENVEAFSKTAKGDYMMSEEDPGNKGYHYPYVYNDKGKIPLNLMAKIGDKTATTTYGDITGGRIVITSPDMKKQILVSGSIKHIEEQFNKFKKDNGLSKVNLVRLDNGSYSRGFRDKDRRLDENDWREYDNRNTGGGSGFYLQGDGTGKKKYAFGGMILKKKFPNGGDINYAKYAPYGQMAAQGISVLDGMDGKQSYAGTVGSSMLSGASMGSTFGPMGAVAGAAIGGGAAVFAAEQAKKAEAEAQKLYMQNLTDANAVTSKQTLHNYATQGVTSNGSYAYGGNTTEKYEVEGDEMVQGQGVQLEGQQQVASDMHRAVGPSHSEGGVDGVGGDRVFSDRLKPKRGGKTYAKIAHGLGVQKGKMEEKLATGKTAAKNTATRMIERIDKQLDDTFNEQEMKKLATNPMHFSSSSSNQKFPTGGNIPYSRTQILKPKVWEGQALHYDDLNHNGTYGTYQPNNGTYFARGQEGNLYPYGARRQDDGRWYRENEITPMAIKEQPLASMGNPVSGTMPMLDVNKIISEQGASGYAGAKKPAGDLFPWQFVDNLANGIATATTPKIPKPYLDPNLKLNTEFDINPQLSSARNGRDAVTKSIDANTAQSGVSNANKQNLYSTYNDTANGLYAQKFNVENELKNKEILINSGIDSRNNDKRYDYDAKRVERRAGIAGDYAQNANNFATDMYTSARDNKMDNRDLEATKMIMAANPDSPQYLMNIQMNKDMLDKNPEMVDSMLSNLPAGNPAAIWLKQRYKK